MRHISRLNGVRFGSVFMAIFAFGYAAMDLVESPTITLNGSFILSFIGGMGNGIASTTNMAILTSFPQKQRDLYISMYEALTGLGVMVGPLLGGGLFELAGFKAPWSFYGLGIVLSNLIFFIIYLRKE